jgi:hypothetical protein
LQALKKPANAWKLGRKKRTAGSTETLRRMIEQSRTKSKRESYCPKL